MWRAMFTKRQSPFSEKKPAASFAPKFNFFVLSTPAGSVRVAQKFEELEDASTMFRGQH